MFDYKRPLIGLNIRTDYGHELKFKKKLHNLHKLCMKTINWHNLRTY